MNDSQTARTAGIVHQEFRIDTPAGRLFAKRWSPAGEAHAGKAPVVLLHDSLGCVELWRDFPERLARATDRSVIAYDRLGFGKSDPHPGVLTGTFIHDEALGSFAALCQQLRLDQFIAFGHSVGGGMAVGCAAVHAVGCHGLITESTQAFVEDRTLAGIREAQRMFRQSAQVDRLRKYHGDKTPWVLDAWIGSWLSPGFADWRLDEDLRQVRCPVLAIHGDLDEYGTVSHPRRIVELAAGPSRFELLEGCGHVPHREQAEAVLETLRSWLSGL